MIWCLGLVWSACAYRVPCLPKLVAKPISHRWVHIAGTCRSGEHGNGPVACTAATLKPITLRFFYIGENG